MGQVCEIALPPRNEEGSKDEEVLDPVVEPKLSCPDFQGERPGADPLVFQAEQLEFAAQGRLSVNEYHPAGMSPHHKIIIR